MRLGDLDALIHTHKSEVATIGKDWTIGDLATAIELAPAVDAIPVEWLEAHKTEYLDDWGEEPVSVEAALRIWQKEQEVEGVEPKEG